MDGNAAGEGDVHAPRHVRHDVRYRYLRSPVNHEFEDRQDRVSRGQSKSSYGRNYNVRDRYVP